MCLEVLPVCMSVYHFPARCLQRPEEGIGSMRVLKIELGSSRRTPSALNHGALALVPSTIILERCCTLYNQTEQSHKSHTTQNRPKMETSMSIRLWSVKWINNMQSIFFLTEYYESYIQRLTVLDAGYTNKPVKNGLAGLRICALFHMFVTYCSLKSENKGKISTESFPGRCVC